MGVDLPGAEGRKKKGAQRQGQGFPGWVGPGGVKEQQELARYQVQDASPTDGNARQVTIQRAARSLPLQGHQHPGVLEEDAYWDHVGIGQGAPANKHELETLTPPPWAPTQSPSDTQRTAGLVSRQGLPGEARHWHLPSWLDTGTRLSCQHQTQPAAAWMDER